jgi:hypothetical protein
MINSIKAIVAGLFSIIVLGLLAQLIFLFVGIAYINLVKEFPSLSFLSETTTVLLFTITAVIAFTGGMLTAKLARKAVIIHCFLVGTMAGTLTLIPALSDGYEITRNGALLLIIILLATVAGGQYWYKKKNLKSDVIA